MIKKRFFLLFLISCEFLLLNHKSYTQTDTLNLTWQTSNTCQKDTLSALLKPYGFTAINGIQFSIEWDTSTFDYIDYKLYQFENAVIGDNQIAQGRKPLIWSSTESQPLQPDSTLIEIRFLPKKCGTNITGVVISDNPVNIKTVALLPDKEIGIIPLSINSPQITIENCLLLNIEPKDTILCEGEMVQVEAFCKDCSYNWSTAENNSTISISENGTYQIIATTPNNCVTTDSVTITFNPSPFLTLGADTTICANNDYQITAETVPKNTILWNTNETTSSITVSQAGNYVATVVNEYGCQSEDSISIRVAPLIEAAIIAEKDMLCPGESTQLNPLSGDFSIWQDTSGTLIEEDGFNAIVQPINTTTYFLIVGNECNMDTTSITLEVLTNSITAGGDTCISVGGSVLLNAKNALSYTWQPNNFPVSNPDIPNPSVAPNESTYYVLEAVDSNFCLITDSVGIFVADNPSLAFDKINFISPNNDGINDVLEFQNLEKFGFNVLKIYNRQGTLVYSRLNYQNNEERWNGHFRMTNVPLPAGVYFYVLKVAGEEIKQTLNLVR